MPSPMNISNNKVPTNTKKVVSESHQAEILSLPWARSSPRLGVVGGTPKPKKSKLVNMRIAPLILKGKKAVSYTHLRAHET